MEFIKWSSYAKEGKVLERQCLAAQFLYVIWKTCSHGKVYMDHITTARHERDISESNNQQGIDNVSKATMCYSVSSNVSTQA